MARRKKKNAWKKCHLDLTRLSYTFSLCQIICFICFNVFESKPIHYFFTLKHSIHKRTFECSKDMADIKYIEPFNHRNIIFFFIINFLCSSWFCFLSMPSFSLIYNFSCTHSTLIQWNYTECTILYFFDESGKEEKVAFFVWMKDHIESNSGQFVSPSFMKYNKWIFQWEREREILCVAIIYHEWERSSNGGSNTKSSSFQSYQSI